MVSIYLSTKLSTPLLPPHQLPRRLKPWMDDEVAEQGDVFFFEDGNFDDINDFPWNFDDFNDFPRNFDDF